MTLTNNLKTVVDMPSWEWLRFSPVATPTFSNVVSDWNSDMLIILQAPLHSYIDMIVIVILGNN